MIAIVNYGLGNLGSIANMLDRIGIEARTTSDPEEITEANKLILPGVGAFDQGMEHLERMGLRTVLRRRVVDDGVPILGICLGAQIMTKSSDEGSLQGLGWVDGKTVRFRFDGQADKKRVPHMGWNFVHAKKASALFQDLGEASRFYFVHSFHFLLANAADVLASTTYGYEFASVFEHGNIYGVQFHPEKSHKYGMQLLKNFVEKV